MDHTGAHVFFRQCAAKNMDVREEGQCEIIGKESKETNKEINGLFLAPGLPESAATSHLTSEAARRQLMPSG